ncbi:MAG: alanine racemase [Ruminococcaceae bacterium]|nr:alanine racemase [Oscillospiraceae bacterium]
MPTHNTYLKIDLDALASNFEAIRQKAGVPVMAVVKANAYGHGAIAVAKLLQDRCAFFGVSSVAEAMELRRAGIDTPILVFGRVPADVFETAVKEQIRLAVFRYEDACRLSEVAVKFGMNAPLHFAVDTGMGRIGFEPNEASADLCQQISKLPNLFIEGLFSHFAAADCADRSHAHEQIALFDRFSQMLADREISIPIRHMSNSAGLIHFDKHYDMVRGGIALYGMYPSAETDASALPISPALEWISRVAYVKDVPAGRPIGYGGTYVTTAPTRIATISVGYADGYHRSLSGKFHVLIRGQKAPILGRVCMDQMMVDVTHIPDVTAEDPVTLIGRNGNEVITVEQIADAAGSFNYEFVCGIGRRVPRIYYQSGTEIETVHYLLDT